jgi:RES domain-containing protein
MAYNSAEGIGRPLAFELLPIRGWSSRCRKFDWPVGARSLPVKISAWRIVKRKFARHAFSGEGARQFGGRWNSPGVAVIYTAASQSLAALELLVRLDSSEILQEYVAIEARFEPAFVTHIDVSELPRTWRSKAALPKLRSLGDGWILSQASAVLRVPSAIIPAESNYLLNPSHHDFASLTIARPRAFRFDPRLHRPK